MLQHRKSINLKISHYFYLFLTTKKYIARSCPCFFLCLTPMLCVMLHWTVFYYPLVMTNSSPWKDPPFLTGKPSISMGHLYHGKLLVITRGFLLTNRMWGSDIDSTNWISDSDPNTKQIEVSTRSSIRDWHAIASYGMTWWPRPIYHKVEYIYNIIWYNIIWYNII